jgi:hypothetical protein
MDKYDRINDKIIQNDSQTVTWQTVGIAMNLPTFSETVPLFILSIVG